MLGAECRCARAVDGGGEETAEANREAQTRLYEGRVSGGGVEVEERVSRHIWTCEHICVTCCCLLSFEPLLQERRRDLPPAEEARSVSGLEQSLLHYGPSKSHVPALVPYSAVYV